VNDITTRQLEDTMNVQRFSAPAKATICRVAGPRSPAARLRMRDYSIPIRTRRTCGWPLSGMELYPDNPLAFKHVLTSQQFDRRTIEAVMACATKMHATRMHERLYLGKGYILGNLFFEPSTRTASSFATAMLRLGGDVVHLDASSSSTQKGETSRDTIRTMEEYTDVIVMRHPTVGSVADASKVAQNPMLNAGDGAGEHPTQALLDCFTMIQECGVSSLDGLNVTMVGDLKNGRTVHSLSRLLSRFDSVTINYVAPDFLRMPRDYLDEIIAAGVRVREMDNYDEVIGHTDVLYMTRIQKERFAALESDEFEQSKGLYVLTAEDMAKASEGMVVMHPLPRVDEIDVAVDVDPRAAYFRQVGYGLSVRMALLAMCLNRLP